jgi:hypothetical protein
MNVSFVVAREEGRKELRRINEETKKKETKLKGRGISKE